MKITSVHFRNFKTLKDFSLKLEATNILTGINNSGKSTVIDAFRALSGALRRARSRKPEFIEIEREAFWGHNISQDLVPVSQANIHTDYQDELSEVIFRFGSEKKLRLLFPKDGGCFLEPISNKRCESPTTFRKEFPIELATIPILSRFEEEESIIDSKLVQRDLYTHRASRHFRNYWYHYPERFKIFRRLLAETWPGMDIELPSVSNPPILTMFVKENRMLREIFWSGSGFQIWCQLLTYLTASDNNSLIVVDEPEIFLHPNLQRKLVGLLKNGNADIILATHSTEIIGECEPSEIIVVDKTNKSAKRLKELDDIQRVFDTIGSLQNITLTKLAKSRRILFVENIYDFKIIQKLAHVSGTSEIIDDDRLVVVESNGYSQIEKIKALDWGIAKTLGRDLFIGAIFDRDYRCMEEVKKDEEELSHILEFTHFHSYKEIENYLLNIPAVERALKKTVMERLRRTGKGLNKLPDIKGILEIITNGLKNDCQSKYISSRVKFFQNQKTAKDISTIIADATSEYDRAWNDMTTRMRIVPGKRVLRELRRHIENETGLSITTSKIIDSMTKSDIPDDLYLLFKKIGDFKELQHP